MKKNFVIANCVAIVIFFYGIAGIASAALTQHNQIQNYDFKNGLNGWDTWGKASFSVQDSVFQADIAWAGEYVYDIGLAQGGLSIVDGKTYMIELVAKATSPRNIEVVVQEQWNDWTCYSNVETVHLGTTMKTFQYTFVMSNASDYNATLSIHLGANGQQDVFIDSVVLGEVGDTSESAAPFSCNSWVDGHWYSVGDIVEYDGNNYIAVHDNPGYNPTISTWFWDLTTQNCSGSNAESNEQNNSEGGETSNSDDNNGCQWYSANLTHYESYPDPGSEECLEYNGCQWSGQFYGLEGTQPESWVAANNIIAVHQKDWQWLGLKTIKLRQGDREITATVYDLCSDSDCNGCCTANLGGDGYLIDIEKYTMERFGSGEGIVEFQVCE